MKLRKTLLSFRKKNQERSPGAGVFQLLSSPACEGSGRIDPAEIFRRGLRGSREPAMAHSNQGIVRDNKGEEQPTDKQRAQAADKTDSSHSVSREATRDPKLTDAAKTPGSENGAG
jgi:hypothetical protein